MTRVFRSKVAWSWLAVTVTVVVGIVLATRHWHHAPSAPGAALAPEPPLAVESYGRDDDAQEVNSSDSVARISTDQIRLRLERDQQILSPDDKDWPTEAFAEAAMKQLHQLGEALRQPNRIQHDLVSTLLTRDFYGTALPPTPLAESFRRNTVSVKTALLSDGEAASRLVASDFLEQLDAWRSSWPAGASMESHFKIIRVKGNPDWSTRVLVEFASRGSAVSKQANTTWQCQWFRHPDGRPLLKSLQVEAYEEAEIQVNGSPWFRDSTSAVIGSERSLSRQLAQGHHEWLQRIERVHRFDTSIRNGLAVGDVNGDGMDDVYLAQPPGLPNRLFIQRPDGTADEQSSSWGVDYLDQTSSALFCDLDNDGDQDLILGTPIGVLLHENTGDGQYKLRETLKTDYDVQSLAAADYDRDGMLDLFVCVYRSAQPESQQSFLYRDALGGGRNQLFRNAIRQSSWSFVDVTNTTGLNTNANRYSFAASWEDYDNDGDPDLYVANDFGPNTLYENRDGEFIEVAQRAGVLDIGSGMSVSWGDYNSDGLMDLYVGNMFSSAGQRVTTQPDFRLDESQEFRRQYQRLAKGNSLFENTGNGSFREVGQQAGVERGRWAWSSIFVDLNNDGWEDLLVANGYISTDDSGDL